VALFILSVTWIAGIYSGSLFVLPQDLIFLGFLPLCFLTFIPKHSRTLLLSTLCLFILFGGNLYYQAILPNNVQGDLHFYNDKGIVELKGIVSTEPDAKDKVSTFQIAVDELQLDNENKPVSGKVLIRVPRYRSIHYGDVLKVTGRLETPPVFEDFDYRSYLGRHGIQSIMNYPRTEVVETDKGYKLLASIYSLRNELSHSLTQSIPGVQASVAKGILLGLRGDIPASTIEAFSRTGTAHLLAISGLHLSIILGIVLSAGIWIFGRRYFIHIWLALGIIWLYALLTGMNAPVVRAAFMGSMFLVGEYLGRQRSAATALAFAAAVMTGFEPQILWDVSFQLSFLAIAGLIFIAPLFQGFSKRVYVHLYDKRRTGTSPINFVIDSFAITLSAILATWPIIIYNFEILSFVGLPATFLALLAMPAIIVTSALTSIAGLFAPLLASIFGYLAWIFLSYLTLIVRFFDVLPFTSISIDNIHPWQICTYYILLISAIIIVPYWEKHRQNLKEISAKTHQIASRINDFYLNKYKKKILLTLLVLIFLIWIPVFQMPDNKLHVTILNVGQGDAILVQTPTGQNILIDGGPSPRAISSALGGKLPFWNRKIDLMASTQPQADHLTGLLEVLNNYEVALIIEPKIEYDSETYREWRRLVTYKKITCINVYSGQEIQLGNDIIINILNPPLDLLHGTSDDIDNNGLVLHLVWNEISFLFTADIGIDAERYLISQRKAIGSSVLKVAHHGSKTSTSHEFLAVVDPEAAVISVGENNKLSLPNFEVISRLENKLGTNRVYTTAENGYIEFTTDGRHLWVSTGW